MYYAPQDAWTQVRAQKDTNHKKRKLLAAFIQDGESIGQSFWSSHLSHGYLAKVGERVCGQGVGEGSAWKGLVCRSLVGLRLLSLQRFQTILSLQRLRVIQPAKTSSNTQPVKASEYSACKDLRQYSACYKASDCPACKGYKHTQPAQALMFSLLGYKHAQPAKAMSMWHSSG